MRKFNHYDYLRGHGVVEVTIRDETGSKIQTFKANIDDLKSQNIIGNILLNKYGIVFLPTITVEEAQKKGFFDF